MEKLIERIGKIGGLNCRYYLDKYLARRISLRMDKSGIVNYDDYADYLEKNPAEYRALIDCLGVNVTEFFRDVDVYQMLVKKIIPDILRKKRENSDRKIRIWSTCCATGEEVYSLAIVLSEVFGRSKPYYDIKIIGTDIDKSALEVARKGVYKEARIKNIGENILNKYFTYIEGEGYRIKDILKKFVRFSEHELIEDTPLVGIDLALCRNMLIYIKHSKQTRIFENVTDSLVEGGILVLGKTETMIKEFIGRYDVLDNTRRVFKKRAL